MAIGNATTMTQERDDERALVAAALADPGAFGVIYERHWLSVYRFCRALGCDDDAALDLTATEIGRVIGKRPDAVQKLISRGLAQLREAYRDR